MQRIVLCPGPDPGLSGLWLCVLVTLGIEPAHPPPFLTPFIWIQCLIALQTSNPLLQPPSIGGQLSVTTPCLATGFRQSMQGRSGRSPLWEPEPHSISGSAPHFCSLGSAFLCGCWRSRWEPGSLSCGSVNPQPAFYSWLSHREIPVPAPAAPWSPCSCADPA